MATDEELRDMLMARAGRAVVADPNDARAFAIAHPRRAVGRWRAITAIASAATVAIAVLLGGVATGILPSGKPVTTSAVHASAGATAGSAPSESFRPGLTRARTVSADELAVALRRGPDALAGRVVIVAGRLLRRAERCLANADPLECPATVLEGIDATVRPVGDIGPGPWADGKPMAGKFALRVVHPTSPVRLDYLGATTAQPAGDAWRPSALDALAPPAGPALYLVHGWIVQTPPHPCPSVFQSPSDRGLTYGCPALADTYVTDAPFQPLQPDGSVRGPTSSLFVQDGTGDGTPTEGDFLLQRIAIAPCGPTADCYVGPENWHWRIVDRVAAVEGLGP
jgi:hypothetical protein